jgi:hypothetical protein
MVMHGFERVAGRRTSKTEQSDVILSGEEGTISVSITAHVLTSSSFEVILPTASPTANKAWKKLTGNIL